MTENLKQDEQERHRAKMANRKAAQDAEVAAKTIPEKGLLIVHTGTGKGKSTAAFGLVLRMVGNGGKCAVVQFIKGACNTGERSVLKASATWCAGRRLARASPGRRRTKRATWQLRQRLGRRRRR